MKLMQALIDNNNNDEIEFEKNIKFLKALNYVTINDNLLICIACDLIVLIFY